jgi:hypothetical protein
MNQNLNHPTIPVWRMIRGHPIAMNANTQAKLIFTLGSSFDLNFFRSKCHINLKSYTDNREVIAWREVMRRTQQNR